MQHDKSIKKIEQLGKVTQSSEQLTQSIADVMDKFQVKSIFRVMDFVKRSGILVSSVSMALMILPFVGTASILALFKSGLNKQEAGQKDVYYDLKNNPKINWRSLLLSIAKQFQYLVNQNAEEQAMVKKELVRIKATIFDDSAIEKTGKSIEGIGYIHDHVSNMHILGFKLLVCGFWDGKSFIPIDFSLHREKRDNSLNKSEQRLTKKQIKVQRLEKQIKSAKDTCKEKIKFQKEAEDTYNSKPNKANARKLEQRQRAVVRLDNRLEKLNTELKTQKEQEQFLKNEYYELKSNYRYCGLKKEEYKNQYKKQRDRKTSGYKRVKEADSNKIDMMIKMLKRTVKRGFVPDYVLTDTWFFSFKILQVIIEIGKNINLVSMARIGNAKYKILPIAKLLTPHEIITRYDRKEGKNNRKYKARYIQFQAEYQGIRVKIFLIRFGTHGNWRILVTTDLNMSFNRIIEVYKIRWTIEVFFKESKQHLLLGKSQSQDFDAQIADITLSLMRYIFLSYYQRIHYGTTIGGLFKQLSQSAIKENLLEHINLYFVELLQIFAALAGVDFIAFYEELLRNPEAEKIINMIGLSSINKDFLNAA